MVTIKTEEIPADAKARQFLESVDVSQGEVIVEQNGAPRLVIMAPQLLEQRRKAKEQLFELVRIIRSRNPDVDSDDLLQELEQIDHPERYVP